jgi:hypothetical protein
MLSARHSSAKTTLIGGLLVCGGLFIGLGNANAAQYYYDDGYGYGAVDAGMPYYDAPDTVMMDIPMLKPGERCYTEQRQLGLDLSVDPACSFRTRANEDRDHPVGGDRMANDRRDNRNAKRNHDRARNRR